VDQVRRDAPPRTVAERFTGLCRLVVRVLPFGLAGVVAPRFVGFVVINGCTFGLDLLVLALVHGGLRWPIGWSITAAYLVAFAASFVLNRRLNFRAHGALGRQVWWYAAAVAVNYVLILLGVGAGLTHLGVPYLVSRIVAGACEGVFMYSALRWVVFAVRPEPA
jgi:putative flippase GtrA